MHITKLRNVGNAVMIAIPQALLEILRLSEGSTVSLAIDNNRLVIEPNHRPRYTMAELLAASDYTIAQSPEDREWVDAPAAGSELM